MTSTMLIINHGNPPLLSGRAFQWVDDNLQLNDPVCPANTYNVKSKPWTYTTVTSEGVLGGLISGVGGGLISGIKILS